MKQNWVDVAIKNARRDSKNFPEWSLRQVPHDHRQQAQADRPVQLARPDKKK